MGGLVNAGAGCGVLTVRYFGLVQLIDAPVDRAHQDTVAPGVAPSVAKSSRRYGLGAARGELLPLASVTIGTHRRPCLPNRLRNPESESPSRSP